jgi:hypothetical protein
MQQWIDKENTIKNLIKVLSNAEDKKLVGKILRISHLWFIAILMKFVPSFFH